MGYPASRKPAAYKVHAGKVQTNEGYHTHVKVDGIAAGGDIFVERSDPFGKIDGMVDAVLAS